MAINVMGQAGPGVLAQQVYGAPADMQQPFMVSRAPQYGLQALMEQNMAPAPGVDWGKLLSAMYATGGSSPKPYDYGSPAASPSGAPRVGDAPKARVANSLPQTSLKALPSLASLLRGA